MITTHDLKIQNPFDFKCKPNCPQCIKEKETGRTCFSDELKIGDFS